MDYFLQNFNIIFKKSYSFAQSYIHKVYSTERMLISSQKGTWVTVTTYTVGNLQAEQGRTQTHQDENNYVKRCNSPGF